MIPSPKLDDRKFEDLVEEAISLIPRYAPEWTNHNPSDPGITLLELGAWLTDQILHRLNRVPEKNYVAFLNLLGIKLKSPLAARTLLQFRLTSGASPQKVPEGMRVSTPQAGDDETVIFETGRDLMVSNVPLDRCFSYHNETFSDNSHELNPERAREFDVFGGAERVEHYLYLSDPRFANAGDASVLRINMSCPERGGRDLARVLEWEYWNGDRWKEVRQAPLEVDRGEACFFGPLDFAPTEVNHLEGLWMRGRLAEVVDPDDTEIDTIRSRVEVIGEGVQPERAYTNLDNNAFILLDLGKNTFPLGKEPKVDCVFYLACEELLTTPGAQVGIEFVLSDPSAYPAPNPSDDLTLVWEYNDGKRWRVIGRSGPRGNLPGYEDHGFSDETRGLTQTGTVSFRRPKDMGEIDVNSESYRWVRVRIEKGDYGLTGSYTLDNDNWVYKDERPLRPPAFRQISFRYREDYADLHYVLTFNDFNFTEVSEEARTEYRLFQPFTAGSHESPSIYLGFDGKLPNDTTAIYFKMAENLGLASIEGDETLEISAELTSYSARRAVAWESEQRVVWEYWDGDQWQVIAVNDGTKAFTTSGFVEFLAPDDWQSSQRFTDERYWLRGRLEMGGYTRSPRVEKILTNVVEAYNHTTIRNERLGSSDATPAQTVTLLHGPLLPGEEIYVREPQRPDPQDIHDLGDNPVEVLDEDGVDESCWVRWRRVESFFDSGPKSRHYTLDTQSRELVFGDGAKGMIPPEGSGNLVARSYKTGGGAAGNVNPGSVTSLSRALAYIEGVTNPISAAGGADRESITDAKSRAPHTIRSRDRAVTAEDFETLALRASTALARARCVPDRSHRGAVNLVLIPKADTADDLTRRLVPSNELLRYVRRYLDERRLVGTVLNVVKPQYRDISIKVTLLRRTIGTSDRLRRNIEDKLRGHLHPLVGGRDGKGWDFGRAVLKTELIHAVEEVPGVQGVDTLEIIDEDRGLGVEHVRIEDDSLPFLIHVRVVEKVRDEIM